MGILQIFDAQKRVGISNYYNVVPDDQVYDSSYRTELIVKDKDYLQVYLCEMFLKEKANYLNTFVPMAVALNVFGYGGSRRMVPVLIGSQMLSAIEKYVKDEAVEFRNIPIIGPVPYTGYDFSIFIGLYRVSVGSLAKSLFGLVNNMVSTYDLVNLTAYLGIAEHLGNGLAELVGMKEVEMRLGFMDSFGMGANVLRDRYLLFINASELELNPRKIWVKEGRLYQGDSLENSAPYKMNDYCLVRIERIETRSDITSLNFHKIFLDCQKKIWEGEKGEAKRLFLTLMQMIANSPDLAMYDRPSMMETYLVNYQSEVKNHAKITGNLDSQVDSAVRGSYSGNKVIRPLSAVASIQKVADIASKIAERSKDRNSMISVKQRLNQLALYMEEIPYLAKGDSPVDLDDQKVNAQFTRIKENLNAPFASSQAMFEALSQASFEGTIL